MYFDICNCICLDTSYPFSALSLRLKYCSCTNIFHRRSLYTFYFYAYDLDPNILLLLFSNEFNPKIPSHWQRFRSLACHCAEVWAVKNSWYVIYSSLCMKCIPSQMTTVTLNLKCNYAACTIYSTLTNLFIYTIIIKFRISWCIQYTGSAKLEDSLT